MHAQTLILSPSYAGEDGAVLSKKNPRRNYYWQGAVMAVPTGVSSRVRFVSYFDKFADAVNRAKSIFNSILFVS